MNWFDPNAIIDALGAIAWVVGLMVAGFLLGQLPLVREHIELCVISFVILSALPFPLELLRTRLKRNAGVAVSPLR